MNIYENIKKQNIAEKLNEYIYRSIYISSAYCPILTNLVPNKCYDIAYFMPWSGMQIFCDYILE